VAILAAVLSLLCLNGPIGAEESATVPTDLGFNPGTGQINPGGQEQAPAQSSELSNIPTPEESRRALRTLVSKQPSLGNVASTPRPEMQTFGGPNTRQESQNAAGGLQGLTSAGSTSDSNTSKTDAKGTSATIALPRANHHPPDQLVPSAKPTPRNSPNAATSSIARQSWHCRCRSAISNAIRSMIL
jgi:hypothetical protein